MQPLKRTTGEVKMAKIMVMKMRGMKDRFLTTGNNIMRMTATIMGRHRVVDQEEVAMDKTPDTALNTKTTDTEATHLGNTIREVHQDSKSTAEEDHQGKSRGSRKTEEAHLTEEVHQLNFNSTSGDHLSITSSSVDSLQALPEV